MIFENLILGAEVCWDDAYGYMIYSVLSHRFYKNWAIENGEDLLKLHATVTLHTTTITTTTTTKTTTVTLHTENDGDKVSRQSTGLNLNSIKFRFLINELFVDGTLRPFWVLFV